MCGNTRHLPESGFAFVALHSSGPVSRRTSPRTLARLHTGTLAGLHACKLAGLHAGMLARWHAGMLARIQHTHVI